MPDTRPYTLASAYLWTRDFARVVWQGDASGLEQVVSVEARTLRHWREEFYRFRDNCYRRVVPEDLIADLTNWLNRQSYFGTKDSLRPLRVTRSLEGDVLSQLRRICQAKTEFMPNWIVGGKGKPDPGRVIAFQNGLLDVDKWIAGDSTELQPATSDWFSEVVQPCPFEPHAECPEWITFLNRALGSDAELIGVLQEWFGYCLTGDTGAQKMLWLHGVSGAGKSTVAKVLRQVVGAQNCVSFDLWSLLGQFTLSAFMGKRLAISADAHLGNGNEADKVLAKLKGISGEDEQLIDRKNREMLSSVRLSVRFVVSTNEFPNLPDASDALARRAIFVPFDRKFQGSGDEGLDAALTRELPGITVWALEGLRRYMEQGRFSRSGAADRVAGDFRRLQSPVHAFVEDWLAVTDYVPSRLGIPVAGAIACKTLYQAYQTWAKENGRSVFSSAKFGERLLRVVPGITKGHPRDETGSPFWEYRGIEFNAVAQEEFVEKFMSQRSFFAGASATG